MVEKKEKCKSESEMFFNAVNKAQSQPETGGFSSSWLQGAAPPPL